MLGQASEEAVAGPSSTQVRLSASDRNLLKRIDRKATLTYFTAKSADERATNIDPNAYGACRNASAGITNASPCSPPEP
jgi:hypothetical protein